ncbi:MAG: SpoIIE family protein phosphatase [Phycisphaeraceae bacterium]|nr:SpoIIE family protein phosphatase [Phycisphaeraceae bacterium]
MTDSPTSPGSNPGSDPGNDPGNTLATTAGVIAAPAAALASLASERQALRQRVAEASVLYKLTELVAAHSDVQHLLNMAARSATKVMGAKAASIRLLSEDGRVLIPKAVYNLSDEYLNKGPILIEQSELAQRALSGEVVYVADMATDDRILYPGDVKRDGLVSMLSAAMKYQGRAVGTIRVYTGEIRQFTESEIELLLAVAHLMAAAIDHERSDEQVRENQLVQRQLKMAAAVQRRMMPKGEAVLPPFEIAARYEASLELGGDFYDLIPLEEHLGIAVCDVVGKGVAASLLMSAVRASLRAFAQDIYDIDEIMRRVNRAMVRDTLDNEFATLFYCVLDPHNRRVTYCNAGHEPPLLCRNGQVTRLDSNGLIIGVDPEAEYEKSILDLQPGDYLLLYTDGVSEAVSYTGARFGRERVTEALKEVAAAGMNAQTAIKHLMWQVKRFTGLRSATDDTTVVVVRVMEPTPKRTRKSPAK